MSVEVITTSSVAPVAATPPVAATVTPPVGVTPSEKHWSNVETVKGEPPQWFDVTNRIGKWSQDDNLKNRCTTAAGVFVFSFIVLITINPPFVQNRKTGKCAVVKVMKASFILSLLFVVLTVGLPFVQKIYEGK